MAWIKIISVAHLADDNTGAGHIFPVAPRICSRDEVSPPANIVDLVQK
jgi:hypothetical protein